MNEPNERPPLGAVPRYVADAQRMEHLSEAVGRYGSYRMAYWRKSTTTFVGWLEEMLEIARRYQDGDT